MTVTKLPFADDIEEFDFIYTPVKAVQGLERNHLEASSAATRFLQQAA
jgi:hypothetical protein